jgi:hypothetical protein
MKKKLKSKSSEESLNEPVVSYPNRSIRIFKTFEDQAEYELIQMSALSPEQILLQLRKCINIAYGMHGYNPDNLPKKHTVKIMTK